MKADPNAPTPSAWTIADFRPGLALLLHKRPELRDIAPLASVLDESGRRA